MTEYVNGLCPERFVLVRHDIDRMPRHALGTAKIENELGIKATYYFRAKKCVFKPNIIYEIVDLGHEIGYHYETLSEAKGDPDKAIKLFKFHLEKFRDICSIHTICMHGRPLSKYDNRKLWDIYDFRNFGIKGEAYLSVRTDLNYFTDTGRSWSSRNNLRDFIPNGTKNFTICATDDLINLINSNKLDNLYILIHPERWSSNTVDWALYYGVDIAVNFGKSLISKVRT